MGTETQGMFAKMAIAAAVAMCGGAAFAEPSRCTLGEAKFMSWAPRERPWTLKGGLLHLDAKPGEATTFAFNRKNDARFLAAFASGPAYRITFKYRSSAKASLICAGVTMDAPKDGSKWGTNFRHEKAIPASDEWREFEWNIPAPQQDCEIVNLRLVCAKGEGFIEMKDLSIVDAAPEDRGGKPLLVNGARAEEVCLYAKETPRRRESDLRAALMFRFALRAAGGEWLPVREVETPAEAGVNAVLVGRLAVDAGVVAVEEQRKVEGLTGGWATAAKGTRLGLAGAVPCGVQRGTWRVLERLGIVYLGSDIFKPFKGDAFATGDFAETKLPGTAFPLAPDRGGMNAELRGWASWECVLGGLAIGSVPERNVLTCDSLGFIIPISEFRETHPEYFALQSDGTRLTDDAHAKGQTHYCWTAPGLAELIASRYAEMMRALPEQPVWFLGPGDGGELNCKCENCRAIGSDSDGLVRLANRVAELTSREFPDNMILMYSYIDTPEPPKNPVKAHKNLYVGYCVYTTEYWPSNMVMPHPSNAKGEKALADWRRECCPNLSLIAYYAECGEWMNFWPGFDANVWLTRDFSEHRGMLTFRFSLHPTHSNGSIGDMGGFADLSIYVISRIEADPSVDEKKLADEFIGLYYGAAAETVREYFAIATAEPRRRDWVQNSEEHLKGFVTKEFAARAFPLLDEAERLAADDPALLVRVRKLAIPFYWSYLNCIGRGRGNVSKEEFKPWARRVAHFAEMCRESGLCYMGYITPKQWFRENIMFELGKKGDGQTQGWPRDDKVSELIADPKKALGGDFPNLQRKTAEGWEIPAEGMMGGELTKKCFWRTKEGMPARCVRRESSGLGLVFTRLDLGKAPSGTVKMLLTGIDNEKESVADIEVKVNSKVVYAGPVKWGKDEHSDWILELPAGLLKSGENEIQFRNTTLDAEAAQDGAGGDAFRATRNYFWGWFYIDKVKFVMAE